MDDDGIMARIKSLTLWQGEVSIVPLAGGRTNLNFLVGDNGRRYVVRLGKDIPRHHVLRFNELAASRAAHAAGLAPAVVHAEAGLTVIEYIDGKTLDEADIADPAMIARIVPLLRRCHRDVPEYLRGPALIFWVFHVIRDYAATLSKENSPHKALLPEFLAINEALAAAAGPFDIVFGHNDLMAANFIDDGKRLWLIDWDYAGFNSPLFDLGGLASNNGLSVAQEIAMLDLYFGAPVTAEQYHRYSAMKCASLLRETMWSMVSEVISTLDIDYAAYTAKNLTRFRLAHDTFLQS